MLSQPRQIASDETASLTCRALSVATPSRTLVHELDITIEAGQIVVILGKNGSGKTLTLHSLSGLREPAAGQVLIADQDIEDLGKAGARMLTLVTQQQDDAFSTTVMESVLLGRHPHIGTWQWESESDRMLAEAALDKVDMLSMAQRDITTLSGGERQRVALAQAFAQDTPLLLLDEPTSQLDPAHARDLMRLLRAKAAQGKTIIASLHDVNVAARYATHVLMLFGDGRWRYGSCAEILSAQALSELYGVEMVRITHGEHAVFAVDPNA